MVKLKRIYEEYDKKDGYRILVDRLWPRGISKKRAQLDLWLKEIAPSTELRKWFAHDPEKWNGFKEKYNNELEKNKEILENLMEIESNHPVVTLLYGAKDKEHNEAVVILERLNKK